jgi:hypothetical protein
LLFDGDHPDRASIRIFQDWRFPAFPDQPGLIPLSVRPFNPTPEAQADLEKILKAIRSGRTVVMALFVANTRLIAWFEFSAQNLGSLLALADDQINRLMVRHAAGECDNGSPPRELSASADDWYRTCRTLLGPINAQRLQSLATSGERFDMTVCGAAGSQIGLSKRLELMEKARSKKSVHEVYGLPLAKRAP